jgi:hypothetical protein
MISKIELKDKYLSDDGIKDYFIKTKNNLQQLENIVSDSELLSIRDELLAEIDSLTEEKEPVNEISAKVA